MSDSNQLIIVSKLVNEVCNSFNSKEDIETIEQIRQLQDFIKLSHGKIQAEAKEILKGNNKTVKIKN